MGIRASSYMIWKLNMRHSFRKGFDLTMAVDNLLNYVPEYYYNNSPTTNGTTFSIGMSVDIDGFFRK